MLGCYLLSFSICQLAYELAENAQSCSAFETLKVTLTTSLLQNRSPKISCLHACPVHTLSILDHRACSTTAHLSCRLRVREHILTRGGAQAPRP